MKNKKQQPDNPKEITMDMPEVKDIPGQEHVKPPRMREMADTTISSADEEGEGILDDLNEEETTDDNTNITPLEKQLLEQSDRPVTDETKDLKDLALDKIDDEDVPNEKSNPLDMGEDLDVPGSELDDDDEELGEEDEENNNYSQPD
ncbi:MAG: hypothetical protein ABI480_11175 [Chitinophagaceae bacterium]